MFGLKLRETQHGEMDAIRKILETPAISSAQLAAALTKANAIVTDISASIGSHEAESDKLLVDGATSDQIEQTMLRHGDLGRQMKTRLKMANALVARLEVRIAEVSEREAEIARKRRYDDAITKSAAANRRRMADMPKATALFHGILKEDATAQLAIDAANADLPRGAAPIAPVEASRFAPPRKAPDIEESEVLLWALDGRPLEDAEQARVITNPDGLGTLQSDGGFGRNAWKCEKLAFVRIRRTEYFEPKSPDPLAEALALPPLAIGKRPGWEPIKHAIPADVLEQLAAFDREPDAQDVAPMVTESLILKDRYERLKQRDAA